MSTRRVRTLEELTEDFHELRDLITGLRDDVGEQGDGKTIIPLFPRVEKLEDGFYERQT